jgi:MraZ protein
MFRGSYEHTLDAKGRLSMPALFREALMHQAEAEAEQTEATPASERLILTTGIDQCLVAYTPSEWHAFEARLASLSQFDPAVVQLKRIYVAGATECALDKNGRLLIPPLLREYADLKRDAVWAGMVTTLEIWAKEHWVEQVAVSRQDPQAVARALSGLGL